MEMNSVVENVSRSVTDTLKDLAKTETIIGKPFQLGEFQVVPVMSVSIGFGTGGGTGNGDKNGGGTGGGGGAGIKVEPIAFLIAHKDQIDLINLGKGRNMEAMMDMLPHVIGEAGQAIKNLIQKPGANNGGNHQAEEPTEARYTHG